MKWINEEARKIYEDLNAQREAVAIEMGLAQGPDDPQAATAIMARRGRTLRTSEELAQARLDYDAAVKPIIDHMLSLANRYTVPDPIFVPLAGSPSRTDSKKG